MTYMQPDIYFCSSITEENTSKPAEFTTNLHYTLFHLSFIFGKTYLGIKVIYTYTVIASLSNFNLLKGVAWNIIMKVPQYYKRTISPNLLEKVVVVMMTVHSPTKLKHSRLVLVWRVSNISFGIWTSSVLHYIKE